MWPRHLFISSKCQSHYFGNVGMSGKARGDNLSLLDHSPSQRAVRTGTEGRNWVNLRMSNPLASWTPHRSPPQEACNRETHFVATKQYLNKIEDPGNKVDHSRHSDLQLPSPKGRVPRPSPGCCDGLSKAKACMHVRPTATRPYVHLYHNEPHGEALPSPGKGLGATQGAPGH